MGRHRTLHQPNDSDSLNLLAFDTAAGNTCDDLL